MENNVKESHLRRTLISVIASVLVFLILFFALCFPSDPEKIFSVAPMEVSMPLPTTRYLVTYSGEKFLRIEYPYTVKKGETVTLQVYSPRSAEISISVYYASGLSTSKVFKPKMTDNNNCVKWEWKIPKKTSTKKLRIMLRSKYTTAQLYIGVR